MSTDVHLQLQKLASQYHFSEYNRAKFGGNGCPLRYLPLSLRLPDKFNELREKQLVSAKRQSWWLAGHEEFNLQHEIISAISTSLFHSRQQQLSTIKTSSTHPINISSMIPPELKALIASHALLSSSQSPTLLEIPCSFTLLRLSALPADNLGNVQHLLSTSNTFQSRSDIAEAINAAISTCIDSLPRIDSVSANQTERRSFLIPDTNFSVALSLTTIPRQLPTHTTSFHLENHLRSFLSNSKPLSPSIPRSLAIGNLYLSSCPGKKVRLDGPVKGRRGVCRDLEADMSRMRHLGVSCIVCCLDDDELDLLGAPWPEYERCANTIGIDVLRLPTPEGLPPTSASDLDGYLVDLINRYSLRGQSILVHCRGGLGRAGVIACCWMIRLGLCGWPEDSTSVSRTATSSKREEEAKDSDPSTIAFVRAVIALVRKQRSTKAIETYEQVKFLVEYVEHLRNYSNAVEL